MPSPLRAVSFDAAGTLFHPIRPVAALYAEVGARHGIQVEVADLHTRFQRAFGEAPPLAFPRVPARELRRRERAWWRAIVAEVFRGITVPDFDAYFADLFAAFADAAAWRLDPGALPLFGVIRDRGLSTLIVSNFDTRIHGILDGLGITPWIDAVTISSEAGTAKPDPGIFRVALAARELAAAEVLHVGNTAHEDWAGARSAGLRALLVGGPELRAIAPAADIVPDLASVRGWLDRG